MTSGSGMIGDERDQRARISLSAARRELGGSMSGSLSHRVAPLAQDASDGQFMSHVAHAGCSGRGGSACPFLASQPPYPATGVFPDRVDRGSRDTDITPTVTIYLRTFKS